MVDTQLYIYNHLPREGESDYIIENRFSYSIPDWNFKLMRVHQIEPRGSVSNADARRHLKLTNVRQFQIPDWMGI
jgi:hypothetical protein